MTATEDYRYTSSFSGETACNQTAQAFMPAVQNLVGKLVRSPQFAALVSTPAATTLFNGKIRVRPVQAPLLER